MKQSWPKRPYKWLNGNRLCVSVPFTWNLPTLREDLKQRSFLWENALVGGPALNVMPDYFDDMPHVEVGSSQNGVLQKINPQATRTSLGCPNSCGFCAVRLIEGEFRELESWPDLPIITDSNLLACSDNHFIKVMEGLRKWHECDFAQGLDIRFLNEFHAEYLAELNKPMLRLALDSSSLTDLFGSKVELLFQSGITKKSIRVFALIGFDSDPLECWQRCDWIESFGLTVNPMWYHALDCLEWNGVSEDQKALGWTDRERRRIMDWYYNRSGSSPLK